MTGARHALPVLVAAAVPCLLLATLVTGEPARVAAAAMFFGLLAALAVIDWRTQEVPDALTLALAATGLVATAHFGGPLALNAGAAGGLLAIGAGIGRFTDDEGWIGSGDYFLFAGLVAWLGPVAALEVTLLAAPIVLATCLATRARRAALAPALALSAFVIFIGDLIP